ncbi:3'-5' exonuclease [Nocardiopsis sp. MT53]|nr:3'-5' exonuclease [Nocardiopsis sp. MT53]
MAAWRAAYLSSPDTPGHGRTLLVTYNKTLAKYLEGIPGLRVRDLDVRTYGRFSWHYLSNSGLVRGSNILGGPARIRIIEKAVDAVSPAYRGSRLWDRGPAWFADEISWISGMGFTELDHYTDSERRGRVTPLSRGLRPVIWKVMENYRDLRRDAGYDFDWDDIATAVRERLAADRREHLYRHIVIDEGQDLSPEQIRSLVDAVPEDGSVTFFGDYAQQIYGQAMSWKSCGLSVRRVERFRDNLRNSKAIADLATAVSEMPFFEKSDDFVAPLAPRATGPRPTLVRCSGEDEELRVVRATAERLGRDGTVAVIARTWEAADHACRGIRATRLREGGFTWQAPPGVYKTTYHSAKGLEFDAVVLPLCGAERIPDRDVLESFDEKDAHARESKLLYVAITRARSELVITYSGTRSPLLPTDPALFTEVRP